MMIEKQESQASRHKEYYARTKHLKRAYYEKNRERILAYHREHHQKNKDARNAAQRESGPRRYGGLKASGGLSFRRKQYSSQRGRANKRGISWNLTFDQWLEFWGALIDERGRGGDRLVMARVGDCGAYELGNIYRTTHRTNMLLGKIRKRIDRLTGDDLD